MATINPYLNFPGTAEEAFNFYKSVFEGEFLALQRFKDIPGGENMPADVQDKIMHISLPVGTGNVLMASDAIDSMGHPLTVGNNFYVSVSVDSKEEADRLFSGLSEGGTIEMQLGDMFWGAYYGAFADKFGIQWMISFENKQL